MEVLMMASKPRVLKDISNVQTVVASTIQTTRKGMDVDMDMENAKPMDKGMVKPPFDSVAAECDATEWQTPASFNRKVKIMVCDKNDVSDQSAAVHYTRDIMAHLKRSERAHPPVGDYMASEGCSVNARMRLAVCDYLVNLQQKFGLREDTLFLGFNVLDRFLAKTFVCSTELQIVGCASLWLASKYHEIFAARAVDFVKVTLHSFSEDELADSEEEIIEALDFDFTVATPLSFAQRFIKFATYKLKSDNDKEILRCLVHYCLELAMRDYQLAIGLPSQIAAAVVCFAMCATKLMSRQREWNHGFGVDYKFEELLPQMLRLHKIVCGNTGGATLKKYRSEARQKVATFTFKNLDLAAIL